LLTQKAEICEKCWFWLFERRKQWEKIDVFRLLGAETAKKQKRLNWMFRNPKAGNNGLRRCLL
jgi:hypothetical protein